MKNFSLFLLVFSVFLLSSCSSDDYNKISNKSETASISFGAILNDQISRSVNSRSPIGNLPTCSDAVPAFVEVILSQNGSPVLGTNNDPLRLNVNSTPYDSDGDGEEEYFTEESGSLELEPGTYTLEYFVVLDQDENELWLAPIENETPGFSNFVNNPLPMDINLAAGVKKYVPVDVLCFDNRFVNQYGYMFFNLENMEVIPFCIFGNFCFENGRHTEATWFSVSVWKYSGDPERPQGENLYTDQKNVIMITRYDGYSETSAQPLCLALPDTEGTDEYYFEITLLEYNYEAEEKIIRSGVITDEDVRELFIGDSSTDYYHFREGNCNLEDSPQLFNGTEEPVIDPNLDTDGDGYPDIIDNCPYQYNPTQFPTSPEYFGEACFEPCTLFTDPERHNLLTTGGNLDFRIVQYNTGGGSLYEFNEGLYIASMRFELVESKVIVDINMNHATYLDDHLIELRDDPESEIICKLVPGELAETDIDDYESTVEIEVPDDFSAPYYIRITGNRIMDY